MKRAEEYLGKIVDSKKEELKEKIIYVLKNCIKEKTSRIIDIDKKEYYLNQNQEINLLRFLTDFETRYLDQSKNHNYNTEIENLIKMIKLTETDRKPYVNDLLKYCDEDILNIIFEPAFKKSEENIKEYSKLTSLTDINETIIEQIYENYNSRSDINLYKINDFHVEFRLFSFDTLFKKKKPSAVEIVNRLDNFVKMTDTFMTNILTKLKRFYDFSKDEVNSDHQFKYNEYFLFNETNSRNQTVKNKLLELFGIPKEKSILPQVKILFTNKI